MDIVLGIISLYAVVYATGHAWQHATEARRKSRGEHVKKSGGTTPSARRHAGRQHDIAWWAREASQGFPVHRTGMHSGWLAHKTALDDHRVKREETRTSHLEARASVLSGLSEHRKRQAEAQERIDKALADAEEAGQPVRGRKAVREAVILPFPGQKAPTGDVPPLPADTVTTRRVDGKPETEADKRFFDLRESGYTGPIDADGNAVMSRTDGDGVPLPLLKGGTGIGTADDRTPSTEGAPPVAGTAEMNYTAALEAATQIQDEAEAGANDAKKIQDAADAAVNDIRAQRISNALEALTGSINDAPTLSEAAEVDDALRRDQEAAEALAEAARAREQAAQQLSEAAGTFRTGLVNRHGHQGSRGRRPR